VIKEVIIQVKKFFAIAQSPQFEGDLGTAFIPD